MERRIWVALPERSDLDPVLKWLDEHSATDVSHTDYRGLDPIFFPIVVTSVVIGAGGLTSFLAWLRRQRRCLMIVDARGDEVKISFDCRERQGRTVVVAAEGNLVQIDESPEMIDLGAIAVAAVEQGPDVAQQLAESMGLVAQVVPPGQIAQ